MRNAAEGEVGTGLPLLRVFHADVTARASYRDCGWNSNNMFIQLVVLGLYDTIGNGQEDLSDSIARHLLPGPSSRESNFLSWVLSMLRARPAHVPR
jgi:hypothetical protein